MKTSANHIPNAIEFAPAPDAENQLRALEHSIGLILAPGLAPILAEGADAADYLHRRLSQNIKQLALGGGAHALQLTGEGRLQADLLVYRGSEALMLLAPAERADADATLIEKYTLNDDVTVDRFYESEVMFALAGPAAPALLGALIEPKAHATQLREQPWLGLFTVMLAGVPCRIFRDGRWPAELPFFLLCAPPMGLEALLRALKDGLTAAHGAVCSTDTLNFLHLKHGVARWGLGLAAGRIPLEAQFYDAIDFNKGCYPGQEFLARINNLGHPANALTRFSANETLSLQEGAALLGSSGEPIGEVTAAASLGNTTRGFAYLKWPHRTHSEASIAFGSRRVKVALQPMPGAKL